MAQGDLVYCNISSALTPPAKLQVVQLNRVGNPVWMTNLENYSFDRNIYLSTDDGGNAYVLANGLLLQLKR